ncbi:pyridoxal phosphate-dependent transferase [Echria macrotheca]|uniref:Pyridoxal phosphate-dependent transferase n=1 Tax=Echria macrotheca TaxID=438768 RepID=A0AAJ0F7A1_9PEZI|nr:pyridoxal phosphate-dependent transferase [Echria macrotheca]
MTSNQAISSHFLGPRAENLDVVRKSISAMLDQLQLTRTAHAEEDAKNGYDFTPSHSPESQRVASIIPNSVGMLSQLLGQHSVPFWSPRYQGNLYPDVSMAGMLGYLAAMLYNPNNVAFEASPITSAMEIEVGEQLCDLFGFQTEPSPSSNVTGWGHITCDGTVANVESLWATRNLKFRPLSLRKAMDDADRPLRFIPDTFSVPTCQGESKPFRQLSTWELLNLTPQTILDIPDQLYAQYGVTSEFLNDALDRYNVQAAVTDVLEEHCNADKRPMYLLSATKHYSWPKGAALAALGTQNMVSVSVDTAGRMSTTSLEIWLNRCLETETPVYSVVAVMGSTEEGAVDPLEDILALRRSFQARGLSFAIHADAAWGGYFATMLPCGCKTDTSRSVFGSRGGDDGTAPELCLRPEAQRSLCAMRHCDSVTVDPQKAGHVPYPSGALIFQDGRMRNFMTWKVPSLSSGSFTGATYGIEGSKPGASAMSTWLAHYCIGLDQGGYGALLAETCYASSRFSALWATVAKATDSFLCVPFNILPAESTGDAKQVETEKQRIRDEILATGNKPIGQKTLPLLLALGSDLNINAFALNWRYPDGTVNIDVAEANHLMSRVVKRLSIRSPDDRPGAVALFLGSTRFSSEEYGDALVKFKRRLGLDASTDEDLLVLKNVVANPLPDGSLVNKLGDIFKAIVNEEVKACRERNQNTADYHSFSTHGTDDVFLSYQSMFHVPNHRRQIILWASLDPYARRVYREIKGSTGADIVIKTSDKIDLEPLLKNEGSTFLGDLTTSHGMILPRARITIQRIIKSRSLMPATNDSCYPSDVMPFYLYGTTSEQHISHILTKAPNIGLDASNVRLQVQGSPIDAALSKGAIIALQDVFEKAKQPFADPIPENFFFARGKQFNVKVWADPRGYDESAKGLVEDVVKTPPLATGTIVLGEHVIVDVERVNRDPWADDDEATLVGQWRDRLKQVVRDMDRAGDH